MKMQKWKSSTADTDLTSLTKEVTTKIPKDVVPVDLNYQTCLEIIKLQSEKAENAPKRGRTLRKNSHIRASRLKSTNNTDYTYFL